MDLDDLVDKAKELAEDHEDDLKAAAEAAKENLT
jgi:hypothetical protein